MAKKDGLAEFLASEGKDKSSVTMDELLVRAEDMTLAEHDKIHHPDGYEEGQECKLREDFKKANKGEELTDPNTELRADAQVSSESRHSISLELGRWLNSKELSKEQRYERQSKFQRATQGSTYGLIKELNDIINGEGSEDVDKVAESNLVGYFQDTSTDGLQEEVSVDLEGEGSKRDISDKNKKVFDAYCCLIGLLRKQDGVSWHAPIYDANPGEMNGIEFDIGRKITQEEYDEFAHYLDDEIEKFDLELKHEDGTTERKRVKYAVSGRKEKPSDPDNEPLFGLVSTRNGVRIINFGENIANREEMQEKLSQILESCPLFTGDTRSLKSTGNLLCGEWSDEGGGNGQSYFKQLNGMFDGETRDKVKKLYEKYIPIVYSSEFTTAQEMGYEGKVVESPKWV